MNNTTVMTTIVALADQVRAATHVLDEARRVREAAEEALAGAVQQERQALDAWTSARLALDRAAVGDGRALVLNASLDTAGSYMRQGCDIPKAPPPPPADIDPGVQIDEGWKWRSQAPPPPPTFDVNPGVVIREGEWVWHWRFPFWQRIRRKLS